MARSNALTLVQASVQASVQAPVGSDTAQYKRARAENRHAAPQPRDRWRFSMWLRPRRIAACLRAIADHDRTDHDRRPRSQTTSCASSSTLGTAHDSASQLRPRRTPAHPAARQLPVEEVLCSARPATCAGSSTASLLCREAPATCASNTRLHAASKPRATHAARAKGMQRWQSQLAGGRGNDSSRRAGLCRRRRKQGHACAPMQHQM